MIPVVMVERYPTTVDGLHGVNLLLKLTRYSMFVRCPPTTSVAWLDGWVLPDSPRECRVVDSMLERLIDVVRSEKPRVRVLVRPDDVKLLPRLRAKGFSVSATMGAQIELTLDLR